MHRALVLLSGGLDSAVAGLLAVEQCEHVHFLSFDYQQRNRRELESARWVARTLSPDSPHDILTLDLSAVARSQRSRLLSSSSELEEPDPVYRDYVPGRNLILLSQAASLAEVEELDRIYIGSNLQDALRPDGRGYPDSGESFLTAAEKALNLGLKYSKAIEIHAPLLAINKFEAILIAHRREFDLALTWSCYEDGEVACGSCSACRARLTNFHWAGLKDPLEYRSSQEQALARALGS